jgi:outer membrane biosynthesis protein TonB
MGSPSAPNGAGTPSSKMTISNETPEPDLLIPKSDLTEATFADKEPEIEFPHRARFDRVSEGRAAIGVMVDAEGNATDFVAIRYTHPSFAEEMIDAIRKEQFNPRKIKGVAVPGRFYVVRTFALSDRSLSDETKPVAVAMNPMEQMGEMSNRVTNSKDGPPFVYKAHNESEIDGHLLKVVAVAAPVIPPGSEPTSGQALKIVVSFYVDGGGDVRLPNVDSSATPALVANTITAVTGWKFERPTIKGKPALVFTTRTMTVEVATPPANAAAPKAGDAAGK